MNAWGDPQTSVEMARVAREPMLVAVKGSNHRRLSGIAGPSRPLIRGAGSEVLRLVDVADFSATVAGTEFKGGSVVQRLSCAFC